MATMFFFGVVFGTAVAMAEGLLLDVEMEDVVVVLGAGLGEEEEGRVGVGKMELVDLVSQKSKKFFFFNCVRTLLCWREDLTCS
jgi:hypothetical protein